MKKIIKVAFLALMLMALINGGKINSYQRTWGDHNGSQITLLDFGNSGDPEYITAF